MTDNIPVKYVFVESGGFPEPWEEGVLYCIKDTHQIYLDGEIYGSGASIWDEITSFDFYDPDNKPTFATLHTDEGGYYGMAFGAGTTMLGQHDIIIGNNGYSRSGEDTIAIGNDAMVEGDYSIAVGKNAHAAGNQYDLKGSISIGYHTYTDSNSVSMGYEASSGTESISIGYHADSGMYQYGYYSYDVSIGFGAKSGHSAGSPYSNNAIVESNIAIGHDAEATGYSIAIGMNTHAAGALGSESGYAHGGIAIGNNIRQRGDAKDCISIGSGYTSADRSIIIGYGATKAGINSITIGNVDNPEGGYKGAVGNNDIAIGTYALAFGYREYDDSDIGSIAIGHYANAGSNEYDNGCKNAIAIGYAAKASIDDMIALGTNSGYFRPTEDADENEYYLRVTGLNGNDIEILDRSGNHYITGYYYDKDGKVGGGGSGDWDKISEVIPTPESSETKYVTMNTEDSDYIIGKNNSNHKHQTIMIGDSIYNDGSYTLSLGYDISNTGKYNIALGYRAKSWKNASEYEWEEKESTNISIGYCSCAGNASESDIYDSIAIGSYTYADASGSVAIGSHAHTSPTGYRERFGVGGVAIGKNAYCDNAGVAVGLDASVYSIAGDQSGSGIAIGSNAVSGDVTKGTRCGTALGQYAYATGDFSVAVGHTAASSNSGSISIGSSTHASGYSSIAVGNGGDASGYRSIAIGYRARSATLGMIALGTNSGSSEIDNKSILRVTGYQYSDYEYLTKDGDLHVTGYYYDKDGKVGGGGGSTVSVSQLLSSGVNIADVTVDGNITHLYAPQSGSTVSINSILSTGVEIAELTIDGVTTSVYAPEGGGSDSPWDNISDVSLEYHNAGVFTNCTESEDTKYSLAIGYSSGVQGSNSVILGHDNHLYANGSAAIGSLNRVGDIADYGMVQTDDSFAIGQGNFLGYSYNSESAAKNDGVSRVFAIGYQNIFATYDEKLEYYRNSGNAVSIGAYNEVDRQTMGGSAFMVMIGTHNKVQPEYFGEDWEHHTGYANGNIAIGYGLTTTGHYQLALGHMNKPIVDVADTNGVYQEVIRVTGYNNTNIELLDVAGNLHLTGTVIDGNGYSLSQLGDVETILQSINGGNA